MIKFNSSDFIYLIKAVVFIKLNNKCSRETYRSEAGAFMTFVKTEVISVQTAMKLFFQDFQVQFRCTNQVEYLFTLWFYGP